MNLSELQTELRGLGQRLAELDTEIEKLKPRPAEALREEYTLLTQLAYSEPLIGRKLDAAPSHTLNAYLTCLAVIPSSTPPGWKRTLPN